VFGNGGGGRYIKMSKTLSELMGAFSIRIGNNVENSVTLCSNISRGYTAADNIRFCWFTNCTSALDVHGQD